MNDDKQYQFELIVDKIDTAEDALPRKEYWRLLKMLAEELSKRVDKELFNASLP